MGSFIMEKHEAPDIVSPNIARTEAHGYKPWLLYSAVITADLPGAMASLGHFGVVQPQLADTLDKMRGSVPVFTNLKS